MRTSARAWRSAAAIIFLPNDRSMKKIRGLGSLEGEFDSDRFFDLDPWAGIIIR